MQLAPAALHCQSCDCTFASLPLQSSRAELTPAIMVDTVSTTTPVCAFLDLPDTTVQHTITLASDGIMHACVCVRACVCVKQRARKYNHGQLHLPRQLEGPVAAQVHFCSVSPPPCCLMLTAVVGEWPCSGPDCYNSTGMACNATTGECPCPPGLTGMHCQEMMCACVHSFKATHTTLLG